jgi:hypothetical protein
VLLLKVERLIQMTGKWKAEDFSPMPIRPEVKKERGKFRKVVTVHLFCPCFFSHT